jgi:hypothetical protein
MGSAGLTAIDCYVTGSDTGTVRANVSTQRGLTTSYNKRLCLANRLPFFSKRSTVAAIGMTHVGTITRRQQRPEDFHAQTTEDDLT